VGAVGVALASALLVSCQSKAEEENGAAGEERESPVLLVETKVLSEGGVETVESGLPVLASVPVPPKWSREDAGFARYLPEDTEV